VWDDVWPPGTGLECKSRPFKISHIYEATYQDLSITFNITSTHVSDTKVANFAETRRLTRPYTAKMGREEVHVWIFYTGVSIFTRNNVQQTSI
jgi:hypothetical protein